MDGKTVLLVLSVCGGPPPGRMPRRRVRWQGAGLAPGEKDVVAAVVPKHASAFDAEALYAVCRARLEANFVPGFVQVLTQIPKTASEKPQERFLIEAFEARPDTVHRPAAAAR